MSRRYRSFILGAVILFLMILLFDVILIRMQYRNYKDKVQIVCEMLSGEDPMQSATGILKGETGRSGEIGERELVRYGYHLEDSNEQYKIYESQRNQIVIFSTTLYFIVALIFVASYRFERRKRRLEMLSLEQTLSDFRNGILDIQEITNESEYTENGKLYSEILSLANYLRLLNERVRIEKEETKSLVTDISHQLKTPVAALKTSFEILQQDNLSISEKKEFADRCSLQLQGIENLLEALINISRMETGIIEIKLENQCIFDTVLQGVNRVLLKADEKGIQIEMEAEEELQEMEVPHDRKWLCEAFINILENAVKYSPSDTCISIHMMRRVSFLRIEIADQGIGIPKGEYNQVFKRFYRGNSREVKVQAGSGVGLYLTREIIGRHNGTVSVSAGEKGIGSIFTIQLPYH
ncbi:MAG TPA: HAMP domain-containing sensor histidine kinase [Lachnospiraceae bacterium]|nr:HAMP domain-containing sensor histidine kinase [Lachnospiraceae bacterium]